MVRSRLARAFVSAMRFARGFVSLTVSFLFRRNTLTITRHVLVVAQP